MKGFERCGNSSALLVSSSVKPPNMQKILPAASLLAAALSAASALGPWGAALSHPLAGKLGYSRLYYAPPQKTAAEILSCACLQAVTLPPETVKAYETVYKTETPAPETKVIRVKQTQFLLAETQKAYETVFVTQTSPPVVETVQVTSVVQLPAETQQVTETAFETITPQPEVKVHTFTQAVTLPPVTQTVENTVYNTLPPETVYKTKVVQIPVATPVVKKVKYAPVAYPVKAATVPLAVGKAGMM